METTLAILLGLALLAIIGLWLRTLRATAGANHAVRERADAVAERAALQTEVAGWESALSALGDATFDALLLLDANRQVTWGNQAAWDIFSGGAPVLGRTFIGLCHNSELNQAVLDAAAGHRPIVRQAEVSERMLRIMAAPAERKEGIAVCIEDVTELQRLGRARRDFVANISHELRTPLANIDLAAQTLRNDGASDPALAGRLLDQIQIQVQTLSQLSQEMMELAQIESGQSLLKLLPIPLEPVIRRSVAHLLPQAALKEQQVNWVVSPDLQALIDEQQVIRVLGNLVHNAVKFTPEGGIISIQAEVHNDEDILVCVTDTGPGIPKADQERIFERFYKRDRARSRGGTGLGLAIARHIIEGHGGRIWVESVPGEGATFCLTLPRA